MSSAKPRSEIKANLKLTLKPPPRRLPFQDPGCRSDETHLSPGGVPPNTDIRTFYLSHVHPSDSDHVNTEAFVPPPIVSASPFVPRPIIRLLMRGKKDSALAKKYRSGDLITNMEGAMHTFVTPIVGRCEIMGDYKFDYGHGVKPFGSGLDPKTGNQVMLTRSVALSASVQPDFELPTVMLAVSKLDAEDVVGKDLMEGNNQGDALWEKCSIQDKRDDQKRSNYDARLRNHMVFHLIASHSLPARRDVREPMSVKKAVALLEVIINSEENDEQQLIGKFMETHRDEVVSLELLYNTAVQQVINEFSALEALFPQGYVYTYDPASIFAAEIGAPILNRLFIAAVKAVSNHNIFINMRVFAINDYADKELVQLTRNALVAQNTGREASRAVRCIGKSDVFHGKEGLYGGTVPGAMLVIHNNSDAFGQNIETEGMSSLDGAIGVSSSAAASLERGREDLLDFIF